MNPLQFATSIPRFITPWTIVGGMFQSLIYGTIVGIRGLLQRLHGLGRRARRRPRRDAGRGLYELLHRDRQLLSSEFLEWLGGSLAATDGWRFSGGCTYESPLITEV